MLTEHGRSAGAPVNEGMHVFLFKLNNQIHK